MLKVGQVMGRGEWTNLLYSGQTLAGIEFGDNKAQQFITEDNGLASIRFRVRVRILMDR